MRRHADEMSVSSDKEAQSVSHKKRKVEEGGDISRIYIAPKQLVRISSTQLETRIDRLAAQSPFTPSELGEVARQKRIVRNREYAQLSRTKKKDYIYKLECENERLKERIQHLQYIIDTAPRSLQREAVDMHVTGTTITDTKSGPPYECDYDFFSETSETLSY